jgi:hypothetical protein
MKSCTGTPAELCALPYIEGTLPEHQVELFEAHFFECPTCLAYLQDLQALSAALSRLPSGGSEVPARKGLLILPRVWALGAAAAILLALAVFSFRSFHSGSRQPAIAREVPAAPAPANLGVRPATLRASQLADLALPPFASPNLRGDQEDAQFESGMKDYAQGDCRDAVDELATVPEQSEDVHAARFYCAACDMRLGKLSDAAQQMRKIAAAGDSPQQESAFYYEAQIALAMNNPAAARTYLAQTIALQGDLEQRARDEDRRIQELLNQPPEEGAGKPESVAR